MFHIHALLVAALGTVYMAQPDVYQHQSRVTIQKSAPYTSAKANLPVESLNNIVGSDSRPMLREKFAESQSFVNTVFNFLCCLFFSFIFFN